MGTWRIITERNGETRTLPVVRQFCLLQPLRGRRFQRAHFTNDGCVFGTRRREPLVQRRHLLIDVLPKILEHLGILFKNDFRAISHLLKILARKIMFFCLLAKNLKRCSIMHLMQHKLTMRKIKQITKGFALRFRRERSSQTLDTSRDRKRIKFMICFDLSIPYFISFMFMLHDLWVFFRFLSIRICKLPTLSPFLYISLASQKFKLRENTYQILRVRKSGNMR